MAKPIKSTDPRKKKIVEAFKRNFGANKVTEVKEVDDRTFSANCFRYIGNKKYEEIGQRLINSDQVPSLRLGILAKSTLEMIDESMKNMKEGKLGGTFSPSEYEKLLSEED